MFFVGCVVPKENIRVDVPSEDTVYLTFKELEQFCASTPGPLDVCTFDEKANAFIVIGRTVRWSLDMQHLRLLVAGELFFEHPETEVIRNDPATWGLGVVMTFVFSRGKALDKRIDSVLFTLSPEKGANLCAMTRSETEFKEIMTKFFK
jgi:hypothetical protein